MQYAMVPKTSAAGCIVFLGAFNHCKCKGSLKGEGALPLSLVPRLTCEDNAYVSASGNEITLARTFTSFQSEPRPPVMG